MDASRTDAPPADRRAHRAVGFGAWCFVLVGVAHLAVHLGSELRPASAAEQAALRAMRATPVDLLGTGHDLAALYHGFSATMALLAIGYGLLNLAVRRVAPEAYRRDRSLTALNTAVAALAFAIAVVAFPLPPVVVLGAALAAQLRALSLTPGTAA